MDLQSSLSRGKGESLICFCCSPPTTLPTTLPTPTLACGGWNDIPAVVGNGVFIDADIRDSECHPPSAASALHVISASAPRGTALYPPTGAAWYWLCVVSNRRRWNPRWPVTLGSSACSETDYNLRQSKRERVCEWKKKGERCIWVSIFFRGVFMRVCIHSRNLCRVLVSQRERKKKTQIFFVSVHVS